MVSSVVNAEFFSAGEDKCLDFLRLNPAATSVRLLRFTPQSHCGTLVSVHSSLPRHVWDPDSPTVVIVPGKRPATVQPSWVRTMAQELLAVGQKNVLAVDWLTVPGTALTAAAEQIGRKLAQTIQRLLVMGSAPDMFHLIGFGVGAHIAGVAGSCLNGSVGRITGLDPFAPVFSEANCSVKLDHADGQYVDVIHTNFNPTEPVPALGVSRPLGHVDFYIGLGFQLPGCPRGLIKREKYLLCSHYRAHQIFTSSIRAPCRHFAFPCHSVGDFRHTHCTLCYQPGLTTCPEMGYNIAWLPTRRPLPFQPTTVFLTVTSTPPYCVTPLLLTLKLGGILSVEAKLYIQLEGNANKTSTMLVSGREMKEFVANKVYQFMISADSAGEFHTITLKFNTQRLLYLEWRKRTISIDQLLLSYLPLYRRIAYRAWNIAAVENRRVKAVLERILV
ncbi:phospholipase A1 member A-like [Salminus brasiliensis]|uniref:phospholipase A1 member A-like n=1 Tax=Salminus brasiliensis TaxID=930266 RepID=UPI003B82C779